MPRVRKIDGIIISVTGYRWNPGRMSIAKELTHQEYLQFMQYMAEKLRDEIVRAIDSQRYKHDVRKWPPLNIHYLRYKQRHKLSLNIWEATGHLKRSVKIFMRGTYIVVGFKRDEVYPNTTVKVNKVAKYVEYGGVRLPPRPLFRAITEYIRKNIRDYYKKFKKDVLKKP